MPELLNSVEGESEGLLVDLSQEADFDSRGEFQVDLIKAREKLEVHLGLWPEDYLSFLLQAAYGLGARKLKLSSSWHSLIWEFDGRSLSPPEVKSLFPLDQSAGPGGEVLARLQTAFFLLTRGRYGRMVFATGLGEHSTLVEWSPKGHQFKQQRRDSAWSHRLELHLRVQGLNLRWLLTRRSALFTLPEYAQLRPRLAGSPVVVEVPWALPIPIAEESLLAVHLRGPYETPPQPPAAASHVFDYPSQGDFSAWFLARKNATGSRCISWGLAYDGPDWNCGFTWLYSDELRTDLSQRQLVHGALLEDLLTRVEQRLEELLPELWSQGSIAREGREWALLALDRFLQRGGRLGKALLALPLFGTVQHGYISLQRLDDMYQAQGEPWMYCCSVPPSEVPAEAPTILLLEPDIASVVQGRYPELRDAQEILQELKLRELQKEQWRSRPEESLEIQDAAFRLDLADLMPGSGWEGEVALTTAPANARIDVFHERRWLAAVPLHSRFPPGYLARVQHAQLPVNRGWTEPDRKSELWEGLLQALWDDLPGWLARLCIKDPGEWLRQRAYDTMLVHEKSQPLEQLALVRVHADRMASLEECRRAMIDQNLHLWVWEGWIPKDRGWRLLHKLAGHDELFRWWSVRLESYYREFQRWSAATAQAVVLPHPKELVCVLDLPENRGQIGMRPLPLSGVELLAFRGQRPIGQQTLPGLVYSLGGLPDGLQVAVNHDGFLPQCSVYEIDLQSASWLEALGWIRALLPDLVEAILHSRYAEKEAMAVRLLGWLPRELWPAPDKGPEFCKRLDGASVYLSEALSRLGGSEPIPVLVEPGELHPLPEFGHVWLLTQWVRSEIAAVWGPSLLADCQEDYLAAWLALEHGQALPEAALLPERAWLGREPLRVAGAEGEVGLCSRRGPGNRCQLRLLRRGRILFEHSVVLLPRPELESNYALHCVLDWPDAPVVGSFGQLVETPQGALLLGELLPRWRFFGFDPPLLEVREYLWERLAFEAGAQENANVGFTLELDEVRERLLRVPLFALEGQTWTLAQVLAYVEAEGRLGYVLGEPIAASGGPILYLSARELTWLKLLLRTSQLANLSHLRRALRKQEQRAEAPRLRELPLPDLDYLLSAASEHVRWGLQPEFNGVSRVLVLRAMREVEVLTFDWRYQVQASINVDELHLNTDGSIRRDADFQARLEGLRHEVQTRILHHATTTYRLELCFRSWGVQEDWVHELQNQPLLADPRGPQLSVQQWVAAWEREGALPYLLPEDTHYLELLPSGPVASLRPDQVTAAAANLAGVLDYREGLRQAWMVSQRPLLHEPAPASFQHVAPGARLWAELGWTEQTLRFVWRGRLLHQEKRLAWPGYELELDWSERLLGQPLPGWTEVATHVVPYRLFLQSLLRNPDLLEESREMWELLPVAARLDASPVLLDPSEDDLRALLGRRKAEWHIRERDQFSPVQHVCQRWWGVPVQVQLQLEGSEAVRWAEEDGGRILWFNPEHRWFHGKCVEVIALRLTFWLQAESEKPWREAARLRAELVKELGMLREEGG